MARVIASENSIPIELRRFDKSELKRYENLNSLYNEESFYIKQFMGHKMYLVDGVWVAKHLFVFQFFDQIFPKHIVVFDVFC